jgi:phosphate starvation-inducible protein PhoH
MSEDKKIRKGVISFDIPLSDEQKEAKRLILKNTCTILDGQPGAAKTFTAMNSALDLLFCKEIDKIYLTRPPIELAQFSKFGALPGDVQAKNDIYMSPFIDAINANYSNSTAKKTRIAKAFENKEIVFEPLPFIRGKNLGPAGERCVVILDEGQSCDEDTMYAILTRISEGSKLIITCDLGQNDSKSKSGMEKLILKKDKILNTAYIKLLQNYRSAFVQSVNKYWFE